MRSATKPWSPVAKAGSHGPDRTRPLPGTPSGMKSSKSSTSLAFESRLSKVQTFRAGLFERSVSCVSGMEGAAATPSST